MWKIYNNYNLALLKQDISKKEQVEKAIIQLKVEADNNEKYKVKSIDENAVYTRKLEGHHLAGFYYLIL